MASFPRTAVAIATFVTALAAPAALAQSDKNFAPDLGVEGQSVETAVAYTLIVTPSYRVAKPGVTVTMTSCKSGPTIRLKRRVGSLHSGETFHAKPGKIVWDLAKTPGKPAKRKLRLNLAIPSGSPKTLCTVTTMYDKLTKNSASITTRVPL